jgi:hypothetical protein
MTDRDNQLRLDRLALQYLAALDAQDFDTVEAFWGQAADDDQLAEMLHGLHAELGAEQDARERDALDAAVVASIEEHLPSAEVIRPAAGPLTAAEVAEHIRRHPPAGLTTDDLRLNDVLRQVAAEVPETLGLRQVVRWGSRFGPAPEAYWRAFREAALELQMRRSSAEHYRLAARPQRPKRPGDDKS